MRKPVRSIAVLIFFATIAAPELHGQNLNLSTSPRLRLVEELRIGNTNDPTLGFSRIGPVQVDRDGNVYAFDYVDLEIRVFNQSGQRIRTIGRKGEGPGEFRRGGPFSIKGDTVWVRGEGKLGGCSAEITLFDRAGKLLSTAGARGGRFSLQRNSIAVEVPEFMRADGNLVGGEAHCYTGGVADKPVAYATTDTVRIPRLLFSAQGDIIDTLGWYSYPPPVSEPRVTAMIEGKAHPIPQPERDGIESLALVDGRVTIERRTPVSASQATLRIVRTRFSGETVFDRVLAYTPMRYSPVVLDSLARMSANVPGGSYELVNGMPQITPYANVPAAVAIVRGKMNFPAFQIPFTSVTLAADESLWLRREDSGGATTLWSIVDRQGVPRGNVELPRRARIGWASGNIVWLVVADADDVPWLVRYRLAT